MSFDKNYPNRKDHRKQYTGAKACDRSCRNHGSCDYCKSNRLYQYDKQQQKMNEELHKYKVQDINRPHWTTGMDDEDPCEDDEQWWNSLDDNQKSAYFRKEMDEYEQYMNNI